MLLARVSFSVTRNHAQYEDKELEILDVRIELEICQILRYLSQYVFSKKKKLNVNKIGVKVHTIG